MDPRSNIARIVHDQPIEPNSSKMTDMSEDESESDPEKTRFKWLCGKVISCLKPDFRFFDHHSDAVDHSRILRAIDPQMVGSLFSSDDLLVSDSRSVAGAKVWQVVHHHLLCWWSYWCLVW